jgi:fatty acid amide hydrolase 2
MNELLKLSAVELAARIRRREVSPVEVVETHIARIEQVNPKINAVVETAFDSARREAEAAEERLRQSEANDGSLPPFLGVPFTVKEHFHIKGFCATAGVTRRRNLRADINATLVTRMRDAGFVLLGTTNVPEGMMWYESYNKIYGRTTNAYSTRHIAGGSSGGEGAIIGAAGSPIGIGGDIGGSIRLPSFFNGIVGHKATGGRVPDTGSWPPANGLIRRFKVCGPMGRTVRDIRAVMPLFAAPDGVDSSVDGPAWGASPEFDPSEITVSIFDDNGIVSPSDEMRATIRKTSEALKAAGFQVETWRPEGITRSIEMWASSLSQGGTRKFIDVLGNLEDEVSLLEQWAKWPLRKSDHILPSLVLATAENLLQHFPNYSRKTSELRLTMQKEIEDHLGPKGVLVLPTFPRSAPRHGLDAVRHFLGFTYCAFLNPLELPSTAVPTGFGEEGLPLGVQVAAARNNDHLTLFVAEQIEKAFGGWQPREEIQ